MSSSDTEVREPGLELGAGDAPGLSPSPGHALAPCWAALGKSFHLSEFYFLLVFISKAVMLILFLQSDYTDET